MKLTTNTQISVDGVMQANGSPVENGRRVLDRGGWTDLRQRVLNSNRE